MPRPYALLTAGADLLCLRHKFLVYNLVGRNLKLKYRESAIGYFWSILIPLITALTYYVVFQRIMNVPVPYYLTFILSGVLPWAFFAQSVTEGMESLRGNASLLGKIPMPPHVFPYVGTVTHMVTLLFSLPVILGVAILSGLSLGLPTFLVLYYLALLFVLAYGFALILSVGFVYFYDLRHIVSAAIQIWFYVTPIVYSENMVPENFRWLIHLNPIGTLFIGMREALIQQQLPQASHLWIPAAWSLGIIAIGSTVYRTCRRNLVEML